MTSSDDRPKRLVMTLGVGGNYALGVERCVAGLKANGYKGEVWAHTSYPEGCPTHQEMPYAFKAWLLERAIRAGFEQVLWLDAACVPVKSLARLWYEIERDGCALPFSPLSIGEWCSDACLEAMEVTREQVMAMKPSLWNCVCGLDLRQELPSELARRWCALRTDARIFGGPWTNEARQCSADARVKGHRHDQTAMTILAYRLGLPFNRKIVQYDCGSLMPLRGYEKCLSLPMFPVPILSNHNVK